MTVATDSITSRAKTLAGRLFVASMVAGLKAPSHVLAHALRRLGWTDTLRESNVTAAAALMGIIKQIEDDTATGTADTAKRIAFLNDKPWFTNEPKGDDSIN